MTMRSLGKRFYDGNLPVLSRLFSLPLVRSAVRLVSPARRLHCAIASLRSKKSALGAADIALIGDEVIITLKDGYRFVYTKDMALLALYQENEPASTKSLLSRTPKGATVIDVGGNIGWYAIRLAKDKAATVHAFEPVPGLQRLLKRNAELNGVQERVQVVPVALADRPGKTFITTDRFGQNRLVKKNSAQTLRVQLSTLDDYVRANKLKAISVIKADIEGAELPFLKGAKKTLSTMSPVILLEIEEKHTRHFGYVPSDVFDFLAALDYRCVEVTAGTAMNAFKGSLAENLRKGNNFLFIKEKKTKKV